MKKNIFSQESILVILCVACAILGVALIVVEPLALYVALAVTAIVALVIAFNVRRLRRRLAALLHGAGYDGSETKHSLARLKLPAMIVSDGKLIWYNDAFLADVLEGADSTLLPIRKVLPFFDQNIADQPNGQCMAVNNRYYTAFGCGTNQDSGLYLAYFINDTALKQQAQEYTATRPSVMMIAVDTYDEILKELKESERARITSEIDLVLEQFIGATSGFLRRISASRYIAVLEERHMMGVLQSRFALLDKVRAIGNETTTVTLSVGVGHAGATLHECEEMAEQALDMALGRGGDQAAVKGADGFSFYGGVSRSVEKRSKVRSRIIATALKDLIAQSDNVLIMGHKMSDLDALGSAIGVLRICKICKKEAAIVVREDKTLAKSLIDRFYEAGHGDDFITPAQAEDRINAKTLLIVTDTQMPFLLESIDLYQNTDTVVVIDHHRKGVGYIDNAVIFYHEPAASSTSELVSELLQYVQAEKETKLTALEAQALLAGIMLDTRNFALHTGVRTFEAAAYLRRMGAQTIETKKLFNESFDVYACKVGLVTKAEHYLGCAVVAEDEFSPEMGVAVPQAANDLLTIDGVQASFVAVNMGSQISVSARSMGEVNVQVILEQLGGGGHLTMAGAQLKDMTLEQAKQKIMQAITEYRENQRKNLTK